MTIENPEIVNGLQTSVEIYNYGKNVQAENETRKILIRVMVPQEEESRDRIIKATNSQTTVSASSLRATDKIQRDIELHLRQSGLYYDRRKNYYKNEGKPRRKIISIPYLAQAVMSIVLRQPDQARARPSSLLKRDDDYRRIFNSEYPIDVYYVCALSMRTVESRLKALTEHVAIQDRNNLRFYVAMHAVSGVDSPKPKPSEIAEFDFSQLSEAVVRDSLEYVWERYLALGGNDQVAKGPHLLKAVLENSDPMSLDHIENIAE